MLISEHITTIQQNLCAKGFFVEVNGEWNRQTASAWASWCSVNNVPQHLHNRQPPVPEQTFGMLDTKQVDDDEAERKAQAEKDAAEAENRRKLAAAAAEAEALAQAQRDAEVAAAIAADKAAKEADAEAEKQRVAQRQQQIAQEQAITDGKGDTIKTESTPLAPASSAAQSTAVAAGGKVVITPKPGTAVPVKK